MPVLSPKEAAAVHGSPIPEFHPHVARQDQPQVPQPPRKPINPTDIILQPGLHTEEVLKEAGLGDKEIRQLALDGSLGEEAETFARVNAKL